MHVVLEISVLSLLVDWLLGRSHHDNRHPLKLPGDSVVISVLWDGEANPGPVVDDSVKWCDNHFLKLNVNKTKQMATHLRTTSSSPSGIKGPSVETVDSYRHPGTVVDKYFTLESNTSAICKKGVQRLFFD